MPKPQAGRESRKTICRAWELVAKGNHGPEIPAWPPSTNAGRRPRVPSSATRISEPEFKALEHRLNFPP